VTQITVQIQTWIGNRYWSLDFQHNISTQMAPYRIWWKFACS